MKAAVDYYSWHSEKPALLYRKNISDTVWISIPLALPDYASHFNLGTLSWDDEDIGGIEVGTYNLDRLGEAEVLVTIHQSHYGSGGGYDRTAINLIDVSDPNKPKLLLVALTEVSESWHGSGDSQESGGSDARRPVRLGPDLRIGKIITEYRLSQGRLLTPLKPGRYHYRNGHLIWVGK